NTVKWFYSYLKNRKQSVYTDSGRSEWADVNAGVPQGSVLGPLLFSMFINDLSTCFKYCNYLLYVDDLVIYMRCGIDDLRECLRCLNEDIRHIVNWCSPNKLCINRSKTK
ncbi:GSCOCG00012458001-RA-CDS, partial [Cotesia congregata]